MAIQLFDEAIFDEAVFDCVAPLTDAQIAMNRVLNRKHWRQRAIAVRWRQPFRR